MEKKVNELFLGDHTITTKVDKEGHKTVKLSHGLSAGVIEIEKEKDGIRIKEMELGSAHITLEHFALMLYEAGVSQEVAVAIQNIEDHYNKKDQ